MHPTMLRQQRVPCGRRTLVCQCTDGRNSVTSTVELASVMIQLGTVVYTGRVSIQHVTQHGRKLEARTIPPAMLDAAMNATNS